MKQKPKLNEIPISKVEEKIHSGGGIVITMSENQWDIVLEEGYNSGAMLLELDENETPIKAYQKVEA